MAESLLPADVRRKYFVLGTGPDGGPPFVVLGAHITGESACDRVAELLAGGHGVDRVILARQVEYAIESARPRVRIRSPRARK